MEKKLVNFSVFSNFLFALLSLSVIFLFDPHRKETAAKSTLSLHLNERTLPIVLKGEGRERERWVTCQLRVETANIFLAKFAETWPRRVLKRLNNCTTFA